MAEMIELRLTIGEARLLGRLVALGIGDAFPNLALTPDEEVMIRSDIRYLGKHLADLSNTLASMHGQLAVTSER